MPVSFTISASVISGNAFKISLLGRILSGTAKPIPAIQIVSSLNGWKPLDDAVERGLAAGTAAGARAARYFATSSPETRPPGPVAGISVITV